MSFLKLFSFNNLLIQYIIAFATLLIAVNISQCLEGLITAIGRWAVVAIIAWFGAKRWRRHHNNRRLTAYKRAVLVTGCDSGFGNALAMKLNEHGFRVYATVLDTEGEGARNLLTRQRFDGQTRVVRMDVTSDQEVNKVYETVAKELVDNGEQLWAVVNNAGILTLGPLDWGTVDTYKRIHEVNTFGMVRVTRVFLPLIRQSKGRIVNLVSMAGRLTAENLCQYSMSKHAAIAFSDGLRRECRKWGVKVSTIEPIIYRTPMAGADYIGPEIERQWRESPDSVRELYGQQYYDHFMARKDRFGSHWSSGTDINEVLDPMVDAIRSSEPRIRYAPAGKWFIQLALSVAQHLPLELYDYLFAHRSRREPKLAALQ